MDLSMYDSLRALIETPKEHYINLPISAYFPAPDFQNTYHKYGGYIRR